MLGYLQPAVPLDDEAGILQDLEGLLDALRGGAQELRQFFELYGISPDVGQDAEQLVEGDGLGPEVGHPADVEPGAFSPRLSLPRRCQSHPLHLIASIAGPGRSLYSQSSQPFSTLRPSGFASQHAPALRASASQPAVFDGLSASQQGRAVRRSAALDRASAGKPSC